MDTKKASHLKKLVNTIKIIDDYSIFLRILIREDWSKKMIWGLKKANLLRLYNMVYIQF